MGVLALLMVVATVGVAAAAPVLTELVSVRSNGKQGDGISARFSAPAVNGNGLVVAFDSAATNLVGGDTNGAVDVFVRDRASGRTQRVSIGSRGRQANGSSTGPALSGDGRLVAFASKPGRWHSPAAATAAPRTRAWSATHPDWAASRMEACM